MGNSPRLVRFDWAAKRLLRNKSNFVILEGFLTTLLGEKIRIERILESEGNQDRFEDKFNRVDMLAENSKGELIIITGCFTALAKRLRNISTRVTLMIRCIKCIRLI